ncbi:hypothetical protein HRG_012565 [Hirsutella rhossiliensis]
MNRGTVPAAKSARTAIGNIRKAIENARNPDRIKILCRDQTELKQVKEAAQKTVTSGARRTAVLDAEGNVLPGAAEALGAENYVTIAKITWLSNRESQSVFDFGFDRPRFSC